MMRKKWNLMRMKKHWEKELDKEEPGGPAPSDADLDSTEYELEPLDETPPEEEELLIDPETEAIGGEDDFIDESEGVAPEEELGGDLNLITNIRYISSNNTVVIDGSQTVSYLVRKNTENHQLIIEILQARLMDNLEWPYPLKDFKTDFGLIQADQKNEETVRVVIQLKEGASFPSTKISEGGNQIVVGFGNLSEVSPESGTGTGADRIF